MNCSQSNLRDESSIREAFDAGQLDVAASAAVSAYGTEILSFLYARLRDRSDAEEVYSMFIEDLWKGLPRFSWRCSMRTWSYTLARNAAARYLAAPHRCKLRNVPLLDAEALPEANGHPTSSTLPYQRTTVKDRFRRLREQLDIDDQMLLVLRVDRNLPWNDLAITMTGDTTLDDAALARESARLRKAFERVKSELRRLAQSEGLL